MKKLNQIVLAGLVASCVFAQPLHAEIKKVAVVDLQTAINTTNKGIRIKEMLKKEMEQKMKEIESEGAKLQEEQKKIEVQGSTYSAEVLNAKRQEFLKKAQTYMMKKENANRDFAEKEGKHTQDIIDDLKVVIQDLAKDGKFDVVFEKRESGILYIADVTDITSKVVDTFNKKFK